MKTLVVGYGNVTRSDDGVGVCVAERIDRMGLKDVETRTMQQLHVDLLEDFGVYQRIVLADACAESKKAAIYRVRADGSGMASSHHLSAELLLALASATDYPIPEIYVCRIPGADFNFGDQISSRGLAGIEEAAAQLRAFLQTPEESNARS